MKRIIALGLLLPWLASLARGDEPVVRDELTGDRLAPAWTAALSKGNILKPTRDGLEIRADENTVAHVRRPLGVDHVRASCELRPGNGLSWCTSLFLYWGPGDWCQMGIIPRNGGCYYVCVMTAGIPAEHDLAACDPAGWHHVAIELGTDVIRFLSSPDGRTWTSRLDINRTESFQGAPRLLFVGKGYGQGKKDPELSRDYTVRGAPAVSIVRNLVVARTEPGRLARTAEERRREEQAGRDALGERELAADTDPSFDSVARHLPALKAPREVVGVMDHPYDLGVSPDGAMELPEPGDGWAASGPRLFFEVAGTRLGSSGCTKRLRNGFLPVVVTRWEHAGLSCEQTTFSWSEGMSDRSPLWGFVRLQVSSHPGAVVPVALRLATAKAAEVVEQCGLNVPAGGSASLCFKVPAPLEGRRPARIADDEFQGRMSEVVARWTDLLGSGMTIRVPEPRVNDAYRAWLAYNTLNVDRVDGRYEIHDGSGFYEQTYGYSAALFCHALDLYGRSADAARYLDSMLDLVERDGRFQVNFGYPDQGALLLAAVEHYRLTGDRTWLKRHAPRLLSMAGWIVRARTPAAAPPAGKRPVTWGLVRSKPYCDYPEPTIDYFGDAYGCVGMESLAEALGEVGMTDDSRRLAREAAAYREDILASMRAAVVERGGLRVLPMEPETHRLLIGSNDRAGGYYGLVASSMLECGFLAPRDPLASMITTFLERRNGLMLGLCEFNQGVDHAYTYGYWMNCLARDQVKRVILGFYASLAYGMGRDTYAGVECTSIRSGEPTLTLPHTYSGTQQLRLLRMMLLREEGDDLWIGQAIPRPWLAGDLGVQVDDAPTRFGPVSFRIRPMPGAFTVSLTPPARRPPREIHLRLRMPSVRPLKRVEVDGKAVTTFEGDTIRLAPGRAAMRIDAWY